MPTPPLCHRTLTHTASPCLGSACALWVPEKERTGNSSVFRPTGNGNCHDNLRAAPFVDPAKDDAKEKP